MIAPHLYPQWVLKFPDFASILKPGLNAEPALTDPALRIEIAFLNRSAQWGYKCQQGLKRAFDITIASLGFLAILPLLVLIALAVKVASPGPIFYASRRIGKNHQPFDMLKFRTMRVGADAEREMLRQQAQLQGELFKMENDPRITAIGKLLRALSLDELPQLINVIRGDMSLVGPRPLPPDESALFQDPYTLRFHVYPGITGLWQVSGRSNLSFQQLCELEMSYVTDWTLLADFEILLRTPSAVLTSRGAC